MVLGDTPQNGRRKTHTPCDGNRVDHMFLVTQQIAGSHVCSTHPLVRWHAGFAQVMEQRCQADVAQRIGTCALGFAEKQAEDHHVHGMQHAAFAHTL